MEKLKKPGAAGAGVDLSAAAHHIEEFLRALGHAPSSDPELANTGKLVASAFHDELLRGYRMDAAQILSEALAADGGDMVLVRDLDVTCICPHHLLPASGVLHVGYVPAGKLVGLGALARLAECFSRRLILQETLSEQIAEALATHLGAPFAACVAELSPACLNARGAHPAHARATSAASAGRARHDAALRAQFFALLGQRDTAGMESAP